MLNLRRTAEAGACRDGIGEEDDEEGRGGSDQAARTIGLGPSFMGIGSVCKAGQDPDLGQDRNTANSKRQSAAGPFRRGRPRFAIAQVDGGGMEVLCGSEA